MEQSTSTNEEKYAVTLSRRVKSFTLEPLHSSAYLTNLATYLKSPFNKNKSRKYRQQQYVPELTKHGPPVHRYTLSSHQKPKIESYSDQKVFGSLGPLKGNDIVLITGRSSAEWINTIGARYELDHRFFYQHLGSLLNHNQHHWYATPMLPSRSLPLLRLTIPSIVSVGEQGRKVDILGLEHAREDSETQLRKALKSLQISSAAEEGRSIVRRVNIFDGNTVVVEQEITITCVPRGANWTVLAWNDAGTENGHDHIPVPSTREYVAVGSHPSFCPVFFENTGMHEKEEEPNDASACATAQSPDTQPLILLNSRYGVTLDWNSPEAEMPLFVIVEFLVFTAAATSQYINMLQHVVSEAGTSYSFPSYEHTRLETMLHYDYAKMALTRLERNLANVIAFLDIPPANWLPGQDASSVKILPQRWPEIQEDFKFLLSSLNGLMKVCEDGKATLMGNASIQEAKLSAQEAKLVTKLTKATNRVTFIFLPISFITSIFGMNFKQFGQGPLSIWVWGVITVPLLIVCILIVERDQWIKRMSAGGHQKTNVK